MTQEKSLFTQIQGFNTQALKQVETNLTTVEGVKYVEKRDREAGVTTVSKAEGEEAGFGFCPDYSPDKKVGTAMEGLLVGSQDVAFDFARLKELGVTHILNVAYGIPNGFPNDFKYLTVEMLDELHESLLDRYTMCEGFIDQALRKKGTVLVHCNAGCSRSTSIALAYVMHKERLPLNTGLERLRETRPAVQPNESFMEQLRTLEHTLGLNISPT